MIVDPWSLSVYRPGLLLDCYITLSFKRAVHAGLVTCAPHSLCKAALSVLQAILLLSGSSQMKILLMQATLLLIQGLDLEALLSLVAAGSPVSGSSHPFFDADSRQKAHDVLGAWWLQANEAHAPVLMAWAVLAALTSSIYEGESNSTSKALRQT